ncbi:MAG: glycoside-pentoside-hexuronide (GPH):cation symporter [Eubacteriales bacterium]|nr:glycoside-pentoside-hexuronide (GPH):cation symporter [Eubacteriales bacterium]
MKEYSTLRNRIGYGIGTIGRDMVAAMVSLYLMFYVTDVLRVSTETLASITLIMVFMRIFDGVNDPFMGTLVDSTQTRWGKFKPWIFGGAIAWAIFHVLMFIDTGLTGTSYLIVFTLIYLGWEMAYTANDIAYWSMIPSLSRDQKEREKIGSVARICASLGMFAFIVALLPVTNFLGRVSGSLQTGWLLLAIITAVLMLIFQFISLGVVREERIPVKEADEKTGFLELFKIIFKNDQLLIVTLAMLFFMSGYTATTGLGIYYFKYIYGDENMYSVFALILGVS